MVRMPEDICPVCQELWDGIGVCPDCELDIELSKLTEVE